MVEPNFTGVWLYFDSIAGGLVANSKLSGPSKEASRENSIRTRSDIPGT